MNITEPLQLTTGSHEAGSGRGCAMNVISWENGDTQITDFPACSDRTLALIVQRVNDTICDHTDVGVLCPQCALVVLDLGHRTVGSGVPLGLSADERHRVWVRVAAHMARQVVHLANGPEALAAIEAAEGWADGTVTVEQVGPPETAALYATRATATHYAAYAAHYAAHHAAYAAHAAHYAARTAARAAAYATTYATYATDAITDDDTAYAMASLAIDKFWELVGSQPEQIEAERINRALRDMAKVGV
jgi:hypothetical protein